MTKIIKSKALAGVLAVAMAIFIAPASQAAVIGSLTVTGTPTQANGNGAITVSGTCPTSGTVAFSLTNNTNVTNLGSTVATNPNGSFSTSAITIPANYPTGSGTTLTATCPNGDTLTSQISVAPNPAPVGTSIPLTVTGDPITGVGTFNVTGGCTTAGTVTFSLVGNGTTTVLAPTIATNSTGAFNANISIPSGVAAGNTTLVATCPNGSTLTAPITVIVPVTQLLHFATTAPDINNDVTVTGTCPTSTAGNTVTFTLNNANTTTALSSNGTVTVGANGNFTGSVNIPTTFPSGLGTMIANCGGGNFLSSLAVVGNPATVGLTLTPSVILPGGNITITGVCPTTSNGVTFTILQNGITTALGTGITGLNANGTFSTTLTLPAAIVSGNANVTAICNNNGGSTTSGLVLGVSTPVPVVTPTRPGSVLGVSTPVGGVRAGSGVDASTLELFFLLTTVIAAATLFAGKQLRNNI